MPLKQMIQEMALVGYDLMDGTRRKYHCPKCSSWYPDLNGVLNCLNKFHVKDMGSTWMESPVLLDLNGDKYTLVKRVFDANTKTEHAITKDISKPNALPKEIAVALPSKAK